MAKRKSAATGAPLTKQRAEQALVLISAGHTRTEAANAIGCHVNTLNKHLAAEDLAERCAAAEEAGRLAKADDWRARITRQAEKGNSTALKMGGTAYVPEFKDAQRIEVTGAMEVTHPDVAAAIERFTQRVVSLATGGRETIAGNLAAGPGEGEARVPVAELDSPSEPGGTPG